MFASVWSWRGRLCCCRVVCGSASEDIKFPSLGTSGLSVLKVRKGSRTIHRLPCFLLQGKQIGFSLYCIERCTIMCCIKYVEMAVEVKR